MSLPPKALHLSPAGHRRRRRLRRPPMAAAVALIGLLAPLALTATVGTSPAAGQTEPAVAIEKATNGVDADAAPGPTVEPGRAVTWTWTVTAVGSVTLYDLVVGDSSGVTPDCDVTGDGQPDGTSIHPGPIEPGQSFRCSASGAADHDPAAGPYAATGTVLASDFAAAATYRADDPSHHTVSVPITPAPGLSIQALVNGQLAAGADGPLVAEGATVTWSYVVRNTGNTPLTGIEVSDGDDLTVDCGGGRPVVAGPLAPGASVTCTATAPAADQADGPQSRAGSVVASGVHPTDGSPLGQVSASDLVTYTPVRVPARLAFTGPTSLLVPAGLVLTAAGAVLLLVTRRRATVPARAIVTDGPVEGAGHRTGGDRADR